ncbi:MULTISPECIES: hypothetical protein [Microbacterium]|uniref:Uncharacterized protein n=1 Tax=Microbacterium wangchenii TaxID=2541726 RepID=A0ABX5SRT8_9MICO|nr:MULTISPECIES: hypothetical protein [Microbacterium]MCK6065411.1 hypothetical protein [Microbacterium sp. EYE_512]QBR88846.1 hypothetical protein E4K62_09185 [Microbacterium wangchenii]
MATEIHYGGRAYPLADPTVSATTVVREIARRLQGDPADRPYQFASSEGIVTIFLAPGVAVAVNEIPEVVPAGRSAPPPPHV